MYDSLAEALGEEIVPNGGLDNPGNSVEHLREIAEKLGVCPKTVDRAVRRMRDDGLIVSTARFDENGSQLGNVYFIGAGPR